MSEPKITPLTFGVELEFLIKRLNKASTSKTDATTLPDPDPSDPRSAIIPETKSRPDSWEAVIDTLSSHGLATIRNTGTSEFSTDIWQVKADQSVEIDAEHRDLYEYDQMEVTTPVFYASGKQNMGLDELRRVMHIIQNKYRIHVPDTAGLHVHVGNGGLGFTLQHVKNLLSVLHVFNDQIQVLHPNRQCNVSDVWKKLNYMMYYRAPSHGNLGRYLGGGYANHLIKEFDTKPDQSGDIVPDAEMDPEQLEPATLDAAGKPEYSQAQRFLENEEAVKRKHVRMRQLFASGPESMAGIGATNIADDQPGAIAQRLFRKESIGVPPIPNLQANTLGSQLQAHITSNIQGEIDPELTKILLSSATPQPKNHAEPDPTKLLAPVYLTQSKTFDQLYERSFGDMARSAYNILSLTSNAYTLPKTIEFRQHQGTWDADRVFAWVQTVTGIVEWTRSASQVQIAELLSKGEELDVIDLLRELGLDEPAAYYEREFFDV